MSDLEWLLLVCFFALGYGLFMIHRQLVLLRTDFRQFGDMISRQLPKSERH
jgi:hypothetical protein